jgi:hypothetical protein
MEGKLRNQFFPPLAPARRGSANYVKEQTAINAFNGAIKIKISAESLQLQFSHLRLLSQQC